MTEVVLRLKQAGGRELVFDDSDVTGLNCVTDDIQVPCDDAGCAGCTAVHRKLLMTTHLTLHFAEGNRPRWRNPVAALGGEAGRR